jgi:hypothetical protein
LEPNIIKTELPDELRGWNWGAFWLNWIWGISNKTYIALLCLVPLINIIMMFILGAKGNQWAWQKREWDSVTEFKKTQRIWAYWGWGLFLAGTTLLGLALGAVIQFMNEFMI